MDDNHILTVGVYVNPDRQFQEGVQLSIFDVSDFANPVQTFNEVIGGPGTYSEATWNPKAFNWYPEQGLVALPISNQNFEVFPGEGPIPVDIDGGIGDSGMTDEPIPVDIGGGIGDSDSVDEPAGQPRQAPTPEEIGNFEGLFVYRVSVDTGFTFRGSISTRPDNGDQFYFYPSFTRGVFIDANVFAVTDRSIVSTPVDSIGTELSRVEIPSDFDDRPFPDDGVAEPEPGIDIDFDDAGEANGAEDPVSQ
jgi:hypothetical protein